MFLKEDNFLLKVGICYNFDVINDCNNIITKSQNDLLRHIVVNTDDKMSWSLVKNVNATASWVSSFTLSESANIYHDEVYFINSMIKSSFSYNSFNRHFKLPSNILNSVYKLNYDFVMPLKFYYQPNNRCYNYLSKNPYIMPLKKLIVSSNQVINLHTGFLQSYFSEIIANLSGFYKSRKISYKKKIFLLKAREFQAKQYIFRALNIKRKKSLIEFKKNLVKILKNRNDLSKMNNKLKKLKEVLFLKKNKLLFKNWINKLKFYKKRRNMMLFNNYSIFLLQKRISRNIYVKNYIKKKLNKSSIKSVLFTFRTVKASLKSIEMPRFKKKTQLFLKKKWL